MKNAKIAYLYEKKVIDEVFAGWFLELWRPKVVFGLAFGEKIFGLGPLPVAQELFPQGS